MSLGKLFKATMKDFLKWIVENEKKDNAEDYIPAPQPTGYTGHGNTLAAKSIGGSSSVPATFNFTVTSATGGKVITVRHYDPRTDRSHENVYIITDKEDLGEELGQIITRESLAS